MVSGVVTGAVLARHTRATGFSRFVKAPVSSRPAPTIGPLRTFSSGRGGFTPAPPPPTPVRITKVITVGGKRITLGGSPAEVQRRETELRTQEAARLASIAKAEQIRVAEAARQAGIARAKVFKAAEAAKAGVKRGEAELPSSFDISKKFAKPPTLKPELSPESQRFARPSPKPGVISFTATEPTKPKQFGVPRKGFTEEEKNFLRKQAELDTERRSIEKEAERLNQLAFIGAPSPFLIKKFKELKDRRDKFNETIKKLNQEGKEKQLISEFERERFPKKLERFPLVSVEKLDEFIIQGKAVGVGVAPRPTAVTTTLPILVGAGTIEEEKTRAAFGGVPDVGIGEEFVLGLRGGRQEAEELFSFAGKGIFGKEAFKGFEETGFGKGAKAIVGSAIGGPIGIVAPIFTRAGGFAQQFVPKEAKIDIPITQTFAAGIETTRKVPILRGFTAPLRTEVREGVPTLALKAPEITELGILTAAIIAPKAIGIVAKKAAILKGIDVTAIGKGTRRVSLTEPIEFVQRTKFDITTKSLLGTEKITVGLKPTGTISKARVAETFAGGLVEPIEAALIKKTVITGAPKISITVPRKGAPIISKGFAEPSVVRGIGTKFIEQPRFLKAPKRISEPIGQTALVTPLKEISIIREFPKGLKIREFRAGITPVTTGVGEGLLRFRQIARISELEKSIVGRTVVEAIGEFRAGRKAPRARVTIRESLRFIGEEPVIPKGPKVRPRFSPEQLRIGILKELEGSRTVTVQTKALQRFAKATQERAAKITPEVAVKVTQRAQAVFGKQAKGISKVTTRASTQAAIAGAVSLAPFVAAEIFPTARRAARPTQVSRVGVSTLQLPSLKAVEAFATAQLPRLAPVSAARTRAAETTKSLTRQFAQFATRPALRPATRAAAITVPVGLPGLIAVQPPITAFRVPPILLPLTGRLVTRTKAITKAKARQGYNVLVKAKGKFKKARKKPLPRNLALAQGARITDNTTSRTFRIKKSKKKTKVRDIKQPRLRKFRKGKTRDTFIEKTAFAIDSRGERAGIPFKGLATLRKHPELRISKKKRRAKRKAGLIDLAF